MSESGSHGVIINGDMGLVSFSAPDSVDYFLYGNEIYFNAIGKQAVVTATYDRGYDESGKEYPKLTTTATIVSGLCWYIQILRHLP